MSLNGKPLEQITEADLQALVDNCEPESRTLDYKQALPGSAPKDKDELRADVTAFANTAGGHLIFGIVEKAGNASELLGIEIPDPDKEILRLESILHHRVSPRIPGLQTVAVNLSNGMKVLVMYIPRSFVRPHAVIYDDHRMRFCIRRSKGKDSLDVQELRVAFTQSNVIERIRSFRKERIFAVEVNETMISPNSNPKQIIHIVPFNAFDSGTFYDLQLIHNSPPHPIESSTNKRYNLDGLITYNSFNNIVDAYAQLYRNGIIEIVNTLSNNETEKYLPSFLESYIIRSFSAWFETLKSLGAAPPLVVMITLLDVEGFRFKNRDSLSAADKIDRNIVILPEIVFNSFEGDVAKTLKPAFDALCNASGWMRSFNYDQDGNWRGNNY
jgi:Putative DNA-binding domain